MTEPTPEQQRQAKKLAEAVTTDLMGPPNSELKTPLQRRIKDANAPSKQKKKSND